MENPRDFQLRWSLQNKERFSTGLPLSYEHFTNGLVKEFDFSSEEEISIYDLRESIRDHLLNLPRSSSEFISWFENLKEVGPGQNDPLFPWLKTHANFEQMKWFLQQEIAGEAGFEDLLAMTQVKAPVIPKLEMARNYWDEMGRGSEQRMHGPMLHRLAEEFEILPDEEMKNVVTESVALSNLMCAFAYHRRYFYHAIGALGVIELTAPGRSIQVYEGLKRLKVSSVGRHYFLTHATIDIQHSKTWIKEVISPIVSQSPRVIPWIAEGAWLRLELGSRCFERYRKHFSPEFQNLQPGLQSKFNPTTIEDTVLSANA